MRAVFGTKPRMAEIPEMTPKELKNRASEVIIIDVRRPDEFVGELGHIAGARLMTLETEIETALPKLSRDSTYVFVCRSGARSGRVTELAQSLGFKNVFNMVGGMIAWNALEYPVER